MTTETTVIRDLLCFHCGDNCDDKPFYHDDKAFCCQGCIVVYGILSSNGMSDYYKFSDNPGTKVRLEANTDYSYLDAHDVSSKLIDFKDDGIYRIRLDLPQIHCSSCLWLLENLSQLIPGVRSSSVNFIQKSATVIADDNILKLSQLVQFLSSIGYEPRLNLGSLEAQSKSKNYDKALLYKLGLAGFAFGNIMLLSFPEYLGFTKASHSFFLGYINVLLAIPVFFYSGFDYIKSAWKSLKFGQLNLDVPIAIGMIVLFSRSFIEITIGSGEGYLDSFSGFVFFLLIGRWFQSMTYQALDFDRKYTSYFPICVHVKQGKAFIPKQLKLVEIGEQILIRSEEIVPCDCIILRGKARIDYSFVTGESNQVTKIQGDELFAGGKNYGGAVEVEVKKKIEDSYLTQLWKEKTFTEDGQSSLHSVINKISKYFIYVILLLASLSFIYWYAVDLWKAIDVFTAVLIVACPCALALSIPFTYGNIVRILARYKLYLRNVETIEKMQDIDEIVFDKTGTLTDTKLIEVEYSGQEISPTLLSFIKSSCTYSPHPLSEAIVRHLSSHDMTSIDSFEEYVGQGFISSSNETILKLGSSKFIFDSEVNTSQAVHIEINGKYVGKFEFKHQIREGIVSLIDKLDESYKVYMLSGDSDQESTRFAALINQNKMYFSQSPQDKLSFIKDRQDKGHHVMMIGDGLNDAGALKQADVGIVFTDEGTNFSPSSDGIFISSNSEKLQQILAFVKGSKSILYCAFILAFMYNIVGLSYAITGHLKPVVAAILMPVSSITIIIFCIASSYIYAHFIFGNKAKPTTEKVQ